MPALKSNTDIPKSLNSLIPATVKVGETHPSTLKWDNNTLAALYPHDPKGIPFSVFPSSESIQFNHKAGIVHETVRIKPGENTQKTFQATALKLGKQMVELQIFHKAVRVGYYTLNPTVTS